MTLGLFPQFLSQAFMQNVSLALFSKHSEDITFYQSLSHCSHYWQSATWAVLADSCQELCDITDTSRFYRTKNVLYTVDPLPREDGVPTETWLTLGLLGSTLQSRTSHVISIMSSGLSWQPIVPSGPIDESLLKGQPSCCTSFTVSLAG